MKSGLAGLNSVTFNNMMQEQEKRQWQRTDFQFHEQLGAGTFGIVYRATHKQSDFVVAIKVIPKKKLNSTSKSSILHKRLQREVEIHSRLKHKSICRMYGYFTDLNHVYLVLEYCANGNLYIPLKSKKEHFSDKKIAFIFNKLLQAVAYLAARNIMHRDIKLQNILFDSDYNPKLTDFGCCVHTTKQRGTICGTVEYLCPQMIKQEKYGPQVDLYCLGVVLYELFYFKSPFYDKEELQIYRNIKQGVIIFDDSVRVIPESAKELIISLLACKEERTQINLIMEHQFVKQFVPGPEN